MRQYSGWMFLAAAVMLSFFGQAAFANFNPRQFRSGFIVDCLVQPDEVEIFKLDELLLAQKFDSDQPHTSAAVKVAPAAGKVYIIIDVRLNEGRSIGRYDYRLQMDDVRDVYECKAMAIGDRPFDPRIWEVTDADSGPETVRLLYETAGIVKTTGIMLVPDLNLTLPQENIEFSVEPVATPADDDVGEIATGFME